MIRPISTAQALDWFKQCGAWLRGLIALAKEEYDKKKAAKQKVTGPNFRNLHEWKRG